MATRRKLALPAYSDHDPDAWHEWDRLGVDAIGDALKIVRKTVPGFRGSALDRRARRLMAKYVETQERRQKEWERTRKLAAMRVATARVEAAHAWAGIEDDIRELEAAPLEDGATTLNGKR